MKWILVAVMLAGSLVGCSPCQPFAGPPEQLCYPADAGTPQADRPFGLVATVFFGGGGGGLTDCTVSVDAGQISLALAGSFCRGNDSQPIATVFTTNCDIPALPAGNYVVTSRGSPSSLAVGMESDGGIGACP